MGEELSHAVLACWYEVLGTTEPAVITTMVHDHVIRCADLEIVEEYCRCVGRKRRLPPTRTGRDLLRMCCSVWAEQLGLEEWTPREVLLSKSLRCPPEPGLWNGAWAPLADPTRPPAPSRLRRELTRLLKVPADAEEGVLVEALLEVLNREAPTEPEDESRVALPRQRRLTSGIRFVDQEPDTPEEIAEPSPFNLAAAPQPPARERGGRRRDGIRLGGS